MFRGKPWSVCIFSGLGMKRQAYFDQLTQEMIKKGFKPAEKNPFVGMGSDDFAGPDLVFKSPNKWMVGIQAVSVKEDLKVGLISGGELRQLLLQYFAGLVLAIILFTIGGLGFKAVGLEPDISAVIALFIFLTIMFLTAFLIHLQRRTVNRKVMKILIETAESMGGKQITPFSFFFKLTTVDLEDR